MKELKRRVSHLTNPDYPTMSRSKMTEEMTVMITPNSDDITQIRLDMLDFEMDGGKEDMPCKDHYVELILPDGNVNIGKLCGNNEGQHLYIHLPDPPLVTGMTTRTRESVMVKLHFKGGMKKYKYNIKVQQVNLKLL